jgi:hypothetical protein
VISLLETAFLFTGETIRATSLCSA